MAEALLTMRDMCDLYQVTRYTIRRWYRAGLVPRPIRVNRTLRWNRAAIEVALKTAAGEPAKRDQ